MVIKWKKKFYVYVIQFAHLAASCNRNIFILDY